MLNDEAAEKTPVVHQDFGQAVRRIDHGVGVDQVAENVIDLLSARTGQIGTDRGPFAEQYVTLRTRSLEHQAAGALAAALQVLGSHPLFVTGDRRVRDPSDAADQRNVSPAARTPL